MEQVNSVKAVEAGGKLRPLNVGSFMLNRFCKALGIELQDFIKDAATILSDFEKSALFTYHAFCDGCRRARIDVDFVESDIYDWIDADPGLIEQMVKALEEGLPQPNEEAKKKVVAAGASK